MKKQILTIIIFNLCFLALLNGQMEINGKTYLGNEWINYDQTYYKVKVGSDGIYRITGSTLSSAGIDIKNISPTRFQLWQGGKEKPIYVSALAALGENDYIEFYGEKHRIQMDTFLYENWNSELVNTEYSLCNDTAIYFLTIAPQGQIGLRVKNNLPNYSTITTPELSYYTHSEKLFFNNVYYAPLYEDLQKIRYSNFKIMEGFSLGPQDSSVIEIKTKDILESASKKSTLRLRYGLNRSANEVEIKFNNQWIGGKKIYDQFIVTDTNFVIDNNKIKTTNKIVIRNIGLGIDKNLLSVAELKYPRKFIFEAGKSQLLSLNKGKNYFTFTGLSNSADEAVYAYSILSNQRVKSGVVGNLKKMFIDNAADEAVFLYTDKTVFDIKSLEKKTFTKFTQFNAQYLAITSKKFKALPGADKALKEYFSYRSSIEGGRYDISEMEVENIYDEFGWGNENHFYAFKNFAAYLRNNNVTTKYICLFGKGREYNNWRNINTPEIDKKTFFIPTFGDYPSDEVLFTKDEESYSNFDIGRISAENAEELETYLTKVKETEVNVNENQSIDEKYWRKRLLHLSGGSNAGEQGAIKGFFADMKGIIEQPSFGGDVSIFYKNTTDPIDEAIGTKIRRIINDGCAFVTFFGHSGVGTWDINIEDPIKWENKGRYPVITSLGCFSGNIHTPYKGIGEKYIFLKNKGGIAYIASSGSAILGNQGIFGKEMYNLINTEAYGLTLGELLGKLKNKYKNLTDYRVYTLNQQMTLLGDPALKLYGSAWPDFTPDGKSLTTTPNIIGSGDKTFDVTFDVYNLGKSISDSLQIRIVLQNFDRKKSDTFFYTIKCPSSKAPITLTIPNNGINALGKNKLFITLDPQDKIDEKPKPNAEQNNDLISENGELGYEFYILDNTAKPVYPPEFGIVNKVPELRIATSNAFAVSSSYKIQLDTTELFNSPNLYTVKIQSPGGTFSHLPNLPLVHNTVYYWRVSPDTVLGADGNAWQTSSFIYLENSPEGWNQSHYYQYKKNPFNFIFVNDERRFGFSKRIRSIEIINGKYVEEAIGYKVDYSNPSASIRPWVFSNGTVGITILDTIKATHKLNMGGEYGSIYDDKYGFRCFTFKTDTPTERKKIIDFLKNHIPNGYYATFFTAYQNASAVFNFKDWEKDSLLYGESIVSLLKKQGAFRIDEIKDKVIAPYTFIFKQNERAISEGLGVDMNEVISNKLEIDYNGENGNYRSITVGPAQRWKNVLWDVTEKETKDSTLVSVYGIKSDGTEQLLINKTTTKNIDISSIDPAIYRNLKLDYYASDMTNRTCPQMVYWRVLADPLPDAAIDPFLALSIPDSIQQGDDLRLKVGISNKSSSDMDSLLTKLIIAGENGQVVYVRKAPLLKQNGYLYENTIDSRLMKGNYTIGLEINPDNDQPEQEKINNIGLKKLKIYPDKTNPILNVSFDGIKIIDGDIVAPKPLIRVELKDENKYLLLTKEEDLEITLTYPDLKTKTFNSSNPAFKFIPASNGSNNVAVVELNPELVDGEYLLKVNGKDNTGNLAGNLNYEVTFNVVNKQSVGNVLNYPNPFSTTTKFIFTITGKVPSAVRIQIMTLSGKVVKEITETEIGPLHIGENISQYAWNGTDDFGNKLANGVYLYKVVFRGDDGNKIDLLTNKSTDKYFTNGIGKLVIVR